MPRRFLHLSDIHLGYQQYGHPERFNDFSRAFERVVDYALECRPDFVLIAGDLFEKSTIGPQVLLQAVESLKRLRRANISVVAITGNHDRTRYRDTISWLDFLATQDYLVLLEPNFEQGMELCPWDGNDGAFIDFGSVRVLGVPYLGSSTQTVITQLPQVLDTLNWDTIDFTILMLHAGLEGEVPDVAGALRYADLEPLRRHVDYLALGHLHKPFEHGGWIYNPGSLEVCAMDESHWQGGFYHVTVDDASGHNAEHIKRGRRPFHRLVFKVDAYDNPEELYDALRARLQDDGPMMKLSDLAPVVEVSLDGILAFDHGDLDIDFIKRMVVEIIEPLIPLVRDNTRLSEFDVAPGEHATLGDLERAVFRDLIVRDARYREHADTWTSVMVEVKKMALAGNAPAEIAQTVYQHLAAMEQGVDDGANTES